MNKKYKLAQIERKRNNFHNGFDKREKIYKVKNIENKCQHKIYKDHAYMQYRCEKCDYSISFIENELREDFYVF